MFIVQQEHTILEGQKPGLIILDTDLYSVYQPRWLPIVNVQDQGLERCHIITFQNCQRREREREKRSTPASLGEKQHESDFKLSIKTSTILRWIAISQLFS